MKTSIFLAPALIGAMLLASCGEQTSTTTETSTTGDTAVLMNTSTPTTTTDPNMNTTTTTVTTDQSSTGMGMDSTTGQELRTDARNTGSDIKEGYKDARDATGEAAGKVGHDVKQGYKNTRDDIKAGVDAAKENKERR